MHKCPFCQEKIEATLIIEGGYCPHCEELILAEYVEDDVDAFEPTELIAEEDLPTDLLEKTEEELKEKNVIEVLILDIDLLLI